MNKLWKDMDVYKMNFNRRATYYRTHIMNECTEVSDVVLETEEEIRN